MSVLYLIPTPIGNLEDITYRAVRLLKEVDLIYAEDTRKSKVLLHNYGIDKKIISHHQHNEHHSSERIVEELKSGKTAALISDAGTPGISDPGFFLVRACINAGVKVECLPGPTALIPALVNSGLPCDRFIFEGFLPQKKGRQTRIKALVDEERTIVLYESPHRLAKALSQLIEYLGEDRKAAVSRELTKMYEETVRGSLREVHDYFKDKTIKGEIVIVIAGKT